MNIPARRNDSGFSMVELMVAMVITLIVTGAIFGLLSSGQSAFKVQPERTDRQQNIRSAIDLISRDIAAAGVGMPAFVQTFTPGLNGTGQASPFGTDTDQLEILTNTSGFSNEEVCENSTGASVILKKQVVDFGAGTHVMLIFKDGSWTVRNADSMTTDTGTVNCSGGNHAAMVVDSTACAPSGAGLGNAGGGNLRPALCTGSTCCTLDPAMGVGFGEVIRYRINNGSDGLPNLERSVNGGAFQIVARGIEDLQVKYLSHADYVAGTEQDVPPAVDTSATNYNTLVQEVRVTLSARAATARIQGATYGTGTANAALRGSLTTQVSPRQVLATLTTEKPGTPKWN